MTEKNKALRAAFCDACSLVRSSGKALRAAMVVRREAWDAYERELDAVEKIPVDDHDRDVTG
jgi:hypothetical protein